MTSWLKRFRRKRRKAGLPESSVPSSPAVMSSQRSHVKKGPRRFRKGRRGSCETTGSELQEHPEIGPEVTDTMETSPHPSIRTLDQSSHHQEDQSSPLKQQPPPLPEAPPVVTVTHDLLTTPERKLSTTIQSTINTATTASTTQAEDDDDDVDDDDENSHMSGSSDLSSVTCDCEKKDDQVHRIARAAAALDNVGNQLFEQGDFDRAMATYARALKLKRRTLRASTGPTPADDDDDDGGLTTNTTNSEALLASVATSMNNIGYLKQRSGEASPDETMKAYISALRIKKKILGKGSLSVGKTLNNVGSVHYLKGEFDKAMHVYEEALHIMQENLEATHLDIGTVISNMGDVYAAKGDMHSALIKYRAALHIRWSHLGLRDPKVIRLLKKVAAIEMGENVGGDSDDQNLMAEDSDDDDLDAPAYAVARQLKFLHDEVEDDINFVDLVQRQMAIDMVRDRVQILRGMKEIELGRFEESDNTEPESPRLSISERTAALDSIKERLARLRESRDGDVTNENENTDLISGFQRNGLKNGIDALRNLPQNFSSGPPLTGTA